MVFHVLGQSGWKKKALSSAMPLTMIYSMIATPMDTMPYLEIGFAICAKGGLSKKLVTRKPKCLYGIQLATQIAPKTYLSMKTTTCGSNGKNRCTVSLTGPLIGSQSNPC